jgi:hypothetical protein
MIVCEDLETLDFAFQVGPCCPTSPDGVDTLTLDWAFQIGPFVAYQCVVAVQQPRIFVSA